MPFEVVTQNQLLLITLRGTFTGQDLMELFASVRAEEEKLPFSPNRLTDLTLARGPELTHYDIARMVGLIKFIRYHNSHKSAIVAPSLLQYGFARMFQMLSTNPQVEVGVFRDMPDAHVWLEAEERQLDPLSLA